MSDELLKNESILKDESKSIFSPYDDGLDIIDLTNNQIMFFGNFLNDFYKRKSEKQKIQITRNATTMLRGAVFALGTKKLNNVEWREHGASSLREIFHEWNNGIISSDFVELYKQKDSKLSEEEKQTFNDFKHLYEYFSGVDHHNASKVLFSLQAIEKNSSLKFDYCYKEETFINKVKQFFDILKKIINFVDDKQKNDPT